MRPSLAAWQDTVSSSHKDRWMSLEGKTPASRRLAEAARPSGAEYGEDIRTYAIQDEETQTLNEAGQVRDPANISERDIEPQHLAGCLIYTPAYTQYA